MVPIMTPRMMTDPQTRVRPSTQVSQMTFGSTRASPVVVRERVLRMEPDELLPANSRVTSIVEVTDLRDLDGELSSFAFSFCCFDTGDRIDSEAPVATISPPDGNGVPVNARLRVGFDELINPLTVSPENFVLSDPDGAVIPCSFQFAGSTLDRIVVLVPHAPLKVLTPHTVTISEVEDLAGRPMEPSTTTFTTGELPDTVSPTLVTTTPSDGERGVPVNTLISMEVNERVDPTVVNNPLPFFFLQLEPTFQGIDASISVEGDGRFVTLIPEQPLAADGEFSLDVLGGAITDFVGNQFSGVDLFFTTSSETDTTAPQVVDHSPADGLIVMPLNGRVSIQLDEPVPYQASGFAPIPASLVSTYKAGSFSLATAILVPDLFQLDNRHRPCSFIELMPRLTESKKKKAG